MTNIMVVSTDAKRLEAAHIALIKEGHVVTALNNSSSALETLKLGGYDVLITSEEDLLEAVSGDPQFEEGLHFLGDSDGELMVLIGNGRPAPA